MDSTGSCHVLQTGAKEPYSIADEPEFSPLPSQIKGRFIEARACFENAVELGIPQAAAMVQRCNDILMNESYA